MGLNYTLYLIILHHETSYYGSSMWSTYLQLGIVHVILQGHVAEREREKERERDRDIEKERVRERVSE